MPGVDSLKLNEHKTARRIEIFKFFQIFYSASCSRPLGSEKNFFEKHNVFQFEDDVKNVQILHCDLNDP